MKSITPTELRGNIYQILNEVLDTGIPVEIVKNGRKLILAPVERTNKLQNLAKRKTFIKGDPEDLVDMTWETEVDLDLP